MSDERSGVGKIERLPYELREQVCRKLRDGETGAKICTWLNSLPEVLQVLDEHFGEQPISPQNLSAFKQGGYRKWIARQIAVGRTKELAAFAASLSQASGGTVADGAAAIASGKVLEFLEDLDEKAPLSTEQLGELAKAIQSLRVGDQNNRRLEQNEKRLEQTDEALAQSREKLQREKIAAFMQWRDDRRATEIADGPGTNEEKTEALGQHIFGDLWK